MGHRILIAGAPGPRLDALASALVSRGAKVQLASHVSQAGTLATALNPHLVALDAPLDSPEGQAWLQALASHPATSVRPMVVLSGASTPATALAALPAGVVALLAPTHTAAEVADALVGTLGPNPDAAAATLAVRTGPALLRRAFAYLAENLCTGRLLVFGLAEPAAILLEQGQPQSAVFGALRGPPALDRLLSEGTSGWELRFAPGTTWNTGEAAALAAAGESVAPGLSPFPLLPPPTQEEATRLPPARVLVVDDDPALVAMVSALLNQTGWATVQAAAHGEQALETARQWRPDLVLADILMPGLNGWDLLSLVRADFRLRETRFALFSGYDTYLQTLQRLQAGADAYINKSARPELLVQEVVRVLSPRRCLQGAVKPGLRFMLPFRDVGLQSLLLALAQAKLSGVATVEDGFFLYRLGFNRGLFGAVQALVGDAVVGGRDALRLLLGAEDGRVFFDPRQRAEPFGWGKPLPALLDELSTEANTRLEAGRDQLLQRPVRLTFDPEGLAFYRRVVPSHVQGVVDALAAGHAPRALLERSGTNPALVEWVVKDLLRKGIGALQEA